MISKFSRSLEQFFLTVGQNNFGNKIPLSKFKTQCTFFFHLYLNATVSSNIPMSPWLGPPSSPRSFCISHQAIGILVLPHLLILVKHNQQNIGFCQKVEYTKSPLIRPVAKWPPVGFLNFPKNSVPGLMVIRVHHWSFLKFPKI